MAEGDLFRNADTWGVVRDRNGMRFRYGEEVMIGI